MIITDIPNTRWRDELLPASFRGAAFHCEAGSWECGRRIVQHEFPKKDLPYAEDMGRRAVEFTVRGYCIAYPGNPIGAPVAGGGQVTLYQRDYRQPRLALQRELDSGQPGVLQLPTMAPMMVVCPRYRLQEDERRGGYCVFDMQFQEFGLKVPDGAVNPKEFAKNKANQLRARAVAQMSPGVPDVIRDLIRQRGL